MLLVLALALAPAAHAAGAGTSAVSLFKLSLGARPAAMAGAFVAVADDANASAWNPAGLAFVDRPVVALSQASLYQGIKFGHLSGAAPLGARGGLGGHLAYMTSGDIERTFEDQAGAFDAARSGGKFRGSGLKLDLSAAGSPIPWLGAGASLDYFRDKVDQNAADGVMAGLGVLARRGWISYGLSLQNAGPQVRGLDAPPTVLRLGAAARPSERFLVALEYDYHFDSLQKVYAVGAEYFLAKALALRLGYRLGERDNADHLGLAGGFGAVWGSFEFDYAFSPFGEIGNAHQLSFSFRFGPERGQARTKPEAELPAAKLSAEVGPEERFIRADILLGARNHAKAREELGLALAQLAAEDRRRVRYFERMGEIAMAEGDLDAAQGLFGEGLKLGASLGLSDPSVADAYAGMGLCLAAKGSVALGIRFLEKSLEFGPTPKMKAAAEARLKELKAARKR